MRIHDGGEHGEHAGVQRVGLGQDAVGFGEHAHEVGIDDGGSEASGMEAAVQGPVPLAGGLKDNQVYAEALQLTLELGRIPAAVLGTRHETSSGNTWISSQFLLTSIPTLESVLVIRSGISLPCIRDMFPIICSGRRPRGGWTSLPHSPCDSGINGPIHPQPGRRPGRTSHLLSMRRFKPYIKGFEWRLRFIKSPPRDRGGLGWGDGP